MITAGNDATATRSKVSNGVHAIEADTKPPLGRSEGLGPHELLEASLASCLAITLRMVAMERGIALKQLRVRVELDRTDPAKTVTASLRRRYVVPCSRAFNRCAISSSVRRAS
jgi:putative redox protein